MSGLVATMIEAPGELQNTLKIPADHMKVCNDDGVPTTGNAAGNMNNFLDLTGQVQPPAPLPSGLVLFFFYLHSAKEELSPLPHS